MSSLTPRKCGNFGAFRVGGCSSEGVTATCGASLAPLYHCLFFSTVLEAVCFIIAASRISMGSHKAWEVLNP